MYSGLSLFLNLVSLRIGFGKTVQKASFSIKSKVDFPKTEVLENPQLFTLLSRGYFVFSRYPVIVFFTRRKPPVRVGLIR